MSSLGNRSSYSGDDQKDSHPFQQTDYPISTSAPQSSAIMTYTVPPQVSPFHMQSFNTAQNANIPRPQEFDLASRQGKHIYSQFHTDQGIVTNDALRDKAYEKMGLDEIPQSATLHNTNAQTYFPDGLTAEFYRAACRQAKAPTDHTIPITPQALKSHIRVLVRAFNNSQNCDDNKGMVKPFLERRHDQKLVECLCWEILQACISRSVFVDPLLTSWDLSKARDSVSLDNFAMRFDAIAVAMFSSKTICKHLFDAPYRYSFVDDPVKAKSRVESNRALNKLKAAQMTAGKQIVAEQQAKDGSAPPPSKRKKSNNGVVMVAPATPRPEDDFDDVSPHSPHPFQAPSTPYPMLQPPQTPQRHVTRSSRRQQGRSPVADYFHGPFSPGSPLESPGALVDVESDQGYAERRLLKRESESRYVHESPGALQAPFGTIGGAGPMFQPSPFQSTGDFTHGIGGGMGPAPPGSPVPMQPQHPIQSASSHMWGQQYSPASGYQTNYSLFGIRQPNNSEQNLDNYESHHSVGDYDQDSSSM
ncbi:uncharacterized protein HMPREF1541_04214 [Cyphellophora europaea CBS 101466]|uniref:Uncharacterized protein n=1 Tax=Cyphellophora europaea (strain CBS 101466) TaxID=1220924 RepID=W2S2I8_CYPE1|nr:uncharacterized protein HMPREF1541_04214 [Cyphellophora europaea CBS 101466]ETN42273.1 hypothetical protein HMPREF1541_04214 [Cyphellophora europaea CBS 101466]